MARLIKSGVDDDDDEDSRVSMVQKLLATLEPEDRKKERAKILETEMNISEFQVEPEVESCMTDFYRKPYAEIHEVEGEPKEGLFVQPVNYYDNDDGFWTEYIEHKH